MIKYREWSLRLHPPTSAPVLEDAMGKREYTPYVRGGLKIEQSCATCGEAFVRRTGAQTRCDACRYTACRYCGERFVTDRSGRTYCSLRCKALGDTDAIERINANRGIKPRTYHLNHRDKHGSAADREWRTAVFQRDDFTCQDCGQRGGRLQAHHIEPYKASPELRHVLANGLTLCVECHRKTDSFGWGAYWRSRRAAKRLQQAVLPLEAA